MARDTQYSAVHFIPEAKVNPKKWNTLPSAETIERTARAIEKRAIHVIIVNNAEEALNAIKSVIPKGASVMSGSSTTLIEIGFEDFIAEGESGWNSLREGIFSENDEMKRIEMRRKSVSADYFVSSANAVASTGEIVACDASGSRVGAWPFAARHLILVVGINKIVPTLHHALDRISEYAFPLEDVRSRRAYGTSSMIGKCVILAGERNPDRTTVVIVRESLGY